MLYHQRMVERKDVDERTVGSTVNRLFADIEELSVAADVEVVGAVKREIQKSVGRLRLGGVEIFSDRL